MRRKIKRLIYRQTGAERNKTRKIYASIMSLKKKRGIMDKKLQDKIVGEIRNLIDLEKDQIMAEIGAIRGNMEILTGKIRDIETAIKKGNK